MLRSQECKWIKKKGFITKLSDGTGLKQLKDVCVFETELSRDLKLSKIKSIRKRERRKNLHSYLFYLSF